MSEEMEIGQSKPEPGPELSSGVQELLNSYWEWRLKDSPEFASFVGIHEYDHLLDDMTMEVFLGRYHKCQNFLTLAQKMEPQLVNHIDILNVKIFKDELQTYIDGYRFKGYYQPISYIEGIHVDLERLIGWMKMETHEDFLKIISRFERVPTQVEQIINLMKAGVAEGNISHKISLKSVVETLRKFEVDDPSKSPLYKFFNSLPNLVPDHQASDLQIKAQQAISQLIIPAFKKLADYIENEYVTRSNIAVSSLPNGEALYNQLLKFHTSTSLSAEEIHEMGVAEVKSIESEMAKVVKQLGSTMTVPEFSEKIKNDPKFFYEKSEDLLAGFEDICYNKIPPKLPLIFKNVPTLEMKIVGDATPGGTGAYYLGPSYDGARPGVFYVNISHPQAQPKYGMLTLSLHEANPGHHFQGSHSIESPNMPFFRRVMEDRNYGYAPSRFPIHTAYMEGWGLYSESLGFDMDLYTDPYDEYGHLSDEIFRACRLVVDTGIHALGWSRQEAIDYMYKHTASSLQEVENEIDRYINWPGQAVAYKVGELKIQELRRKCSTELADNFDIKEFHNIVLESVGPLNILEDEIDEWIITVKK